MSRKNVSLSILAGLMIAGSALVGLGCGGVWGGGGVLGVATSASRLGLEVSCRKDNKAKDCYDLTNMCAGGIGGSIDLASAEMYYNKACDLGHAAACKAVNRTVPATTN